MGTFRDKHGRMRQMMGGVLKSLLDQAADGEKDWEYLPTPLERCNERKEKRRKKKRKDQRKARKRSRR